MSSEDLEWSAWKEVHQNLVNAILIAREAVASQKSQRRFWLTEICANLTEEGKLTENSVWKRPLPSKKTTKRSTKAAKAGGTKRKRQEKTEGSKSSKKSSKTKDSVEEETSRKKPRLSIKAKVEVDDPDSEQEETDVDDASDDGSNARHSEGNEESFLSARDCESQEASSWVEGSGMSNTATGTPGDTSPTPHAFSSFLPEHAQYFARNTTSSSFAYGGKSTGNYSAGSDEDTDEDDY